MQKNGTENITMKVMVIFTIEFGNVVVITVVVKYGKFSTGLDSINPLDLIA